MSTIININDVINTTTTAVVPSGAEGAARLLQSLPERYPHRAAAERDVSVAELAVLLAELPGLDGLQHKQQADGAGRHQLQVRRRVSVWRSERREQNRERGERGESKRVER